MERAAASVYATFENGVFVPEQPVQLPSGTRVQLIFNFQPPPLSPAERDKAWQEFDELCEEISFDSGGERLTRDQLHERR